ncbi:MAG: magnesium transporter [Cyclobacteriaceae bacterium]|nr:magnesium transporter [Cyclobacteriaceae bacterium]
MEIKDLHEWIEDLSRFDKARNLIPLLQKMPVVDVGIILQELDDEVLIELFPLFTRHQQGLIFAEFPITRQLRFFQHVSKRRFAPIFEYMPSDVRSDLYQHMSQQEQVALLPYLSKSIRENVISLSAYPPETAGGIMSTDFATVLANMSIEEAIAKVRSDSPSKKMVYYVYVVDNQMKLTGFITLKDLIMALPGQKVREIIHENFVYASVDEDRESVAFKIEKYDLVAIPIVNSQNQLLGIVTHDDAIEVIRAEHTEDLEKFMGIVPDKEDQAYLETSSIQHFKKRVVWVVSLAAVGILSGMIIHSYESTLEKLMILALYMPMVADTGGNAGSQAATVIVRALALGHITAANWLRVLWKEARISILIAFCLGVIAFAKVLFLSWETEIPESLNLTKIAFVISLALSLQVVTATVIGAGLPILVKRFGGDPAVAASPAITTVVDITGLLIYFTVATLFFTL